MNGEPNFQMVYCPCPDPEEAERIALDLVQENVAAAVNIVTGVRSVFRWRGKVRTTPECLLIIKCASARYADIEGRIRSLHSYELPGIVAVPIVAGYDPYLDWLQK